MAQLTMKQCLADFLRNLTAVQAITEGRLFNVTRPRNSVMPALSYRRISRNRSSMSERPMAFSGEHGYKIPLFEIMCWGNNADQADALAIAVEGEDVRDANGKYTGQVTGIDGFSGRMGGVNGTGLCVSLAQIMDWEDMAFEPKDGSDHYDYAVRLEVSVNFEEAGAG